MMRTPRPLAPKGRLSKLPSSIWTIPVLLVLIFLGWAIGYVPLFFNRPIYLSGTVMDEEGRPLKNVTLKVAKSTFVLTNGSSYRIKRSKRTVNGSFGIMCLSCTSVRLRFFKEGYYDAKLEVAGETTGFLNGLDHRYMPVVLEQTGPLPHLERFRGILRFSADGIETVVPIHSVFGRYGGTVDSLSDRLGEPSGSEPAGPLYVALEARVGEDGKLAIERKRRPLEQKPASSAANGMLECPVDVVLDLSAAKGGISIYQPPDGLTGYEEFSRVSRSMRIAPADGYRARVELDSCRKGGYYFYCTVNGLYGKGRISAPRLRRWRRHRTVEAHVEMRINPDGSRNVASLD